MAPSLRPVVVCGLFCVACGIPAVGRAPTLQSANPSPAPVWGTAIDDTCVSISESANNYWCQTSCAVGVCPDTVCKCGAEATAQANEDATQAEEDPAPAVSLVAGVKGPSPTNCVSISPSANDYWCLTTCSTGHCPQKVCKCDAADNANSALVVDVTKEAAEKVEAKVATEATEPAMEPTTSTSKAEETKEVFHAAKLKSKHSAKWVATHASKKHSATWLAKKHAPAQKHARVQKHARAQKHSPVQKMKSKALKPVSKPTAADDINDSAKEGASVVVIGADGEEEAGSKDALDGPPKDPVDPSSCLATSPGATDRWCFDTCSSGPCPDEFCKCSRVITTPP